MTTGDTYTLREDIRGLFNRNTVYGRKGDRVTLVSLQPPVYIVEGPDGNRFPVVAEDLELGVTTALPTELRHDPSPKKTIRTKSLPASSPTLF